jgi:hypothetical protein
MCRYLFINQTLKKEMSRKAPLISLADLKHKLKKYTDSEDFPWNFSDRINKDLMKVQFDFENFEWEGKGFGNLPCGFQVLKNGLPVLFCNAGGDWENPICFILYWDGKEIRAYIPKNGNPWDKKYKTAMGSEQESQKWEAEGHDWTEDLIERTEEEQDADPMAIEEDIIGRIKIF